MAAAASQYIPVVEISLVSRTGNRPEIAESKLRGAVVSEAHAGGTPSDGGLLPLEEVLFAYGKIEVTYKVVDPATGKPGGKISGGWDWVKHQRF